MIAARGYAALQAGGPMTPFAFERRDPGPHDVVLEITHCGICHTDLHFVNNDWKYSSYPLVPGHEIVGQVRAVGDDVGTLAVGDVAGVGCLVDSCRECEPCRAGDEHFCERGPTGTYGGRERASGATTYGGYSDVLVVDERFALRLPPEADPVSSAPLLCAGITTYSPLRQWKVGPGSVVGVVGLGGLGHLGVKIAKALGAEVSLFTTSPGKAQDALRLGADDVVVSTDRKSMKARARRFDFVLDTVAAEHDLNALLSVLNRDGTLCLVGVPPTPAPVFAGHLVGMRRRLTGSNIGGMRETQEMLDFCAANGIGSDVELVSPNDIDAAYDRILRNDVRYRFVIDMASLK